MDEERGPPEVLRYDGVGAALRQARERVGLSLEDVAVALRIQHSHLDALERGSFQELPGPAYAVGFIRSYARYLRLDGEAAVAQFKAETAIAPGRARLVAPEPIGEPRRPRGLLLGVSLLLAAGVYGGWTWMQERGRLNLEPVPPPPQSAGPQAGAPPAGSPQAAAPSVAPMRAAEPPAPSLQADTGTAATPLTPTAPSSVASIPPAPAPTAPPPPAGSPIAASPAPAASQPPAALAEATEPTEEEEEEEGTPPPTANGAPGAPPALPAQIVGAPSGAGQVYGAGNADARVVIRATGESWVQIKGANNEILLTRTLRAGDTYLAPNRPDLTLWTGNAGALEILLDGAPLPPVGGPGVSKRDISLDPARLAQGRG